MRINAGFFRRDVLVVAPELLGKRLVRVFPREKKVSGIITEVEAYRGEEDLACHAARGRTTRTEVMYRAGGVVYVYFIYGMYWLLNLVTGTVNEPQAVLVRGIELPDGTRVDGPGRVGRLLELGRSFYGEDLGTSERIWVEEGAVEGFRVEQTERIGVAYAGEWAKKPWRWVRV